ncbi:MAG: hypothetical protein FP826_09310 [Sphingomonadales bacterium]|nr:hypothetical protein [Sphingomonadales bacterium]MBU3991563.1 hypothetical protein [Alphaproteobacteria bacterium]
MSNSKTKGAAQGAPRQTPILLAVGELVGGGRVIADGEELTADKIAALKLGEDDVAGLIKRGKIAEAWARAVEAVGAPELAAAVARAETAEAKAAALQQQVDELTGQLAEATRPVGDKK